MDSSLNELHSVKISNENILISNNVLEKKLNDLKELSHALNHSDESDKELKSKSNKIIQFQNTFFI